MVLAVALDPAEGSDFAPARSYDPPTAELVVDGDGRIAAFTVRAGGPVTQLGRGDADIRDLAPTVCALLGVAPPWPMEGRPIAALVGEPAPG